MVQSSEQKIAVLIVEDHHLVRGAIVTLLAKEPDLEVVCEVGEASAIERCVQQHQPDVVLLDVQMPDHAPMKATQQLKMRHPGVQILVLSAHDRTEYVMGMLRAGASGYVLKDDPPATLPLAIRAVYRGEQWLSSRVTQIVLSSTSASTSVPLLELTAREIHVLQLMAKGISNTEIAENLGITEQTVKNYVRSIFSKLGVKTRVEAVLHAINTGLVLES